MATTVTYTGSCRTRLYSSSTWRYTNQAAQGNYNDGNDQVNGVSQVGMIRFADLTSIDWSTKIIQSITLSLTHGSIGKYDGSSKAFSFWPSNFQSFDSVTGNGSTIISGLSGWGEVSKACSKNTAISFNLSSDNSAVFTGLCNYLKSGGKNTIALYKEEAINYSSYSTNYLAVTAASITITYEDAIVYYGVGGEWVPCIPYYGVNGEWKQCIPYYGVNGEWKQV